MALSAAVCCCLAIVAGVMAARALSAGDEVYCNVCTLPASGVPAVSTARWTFDKNFLVGMETHDYQIYMYNDNLNEVKCSVAMTNDILTSPCSPPSGYKWTARCHTLNGDGPANDTQCSAEYTGG
jgi:hypothetical protein